MKQACTNCGYSFEITDKDLAFYEKISPEFSGKKHPFPQPDMCPDCRQQCRMAHRNERSLYHRKCDKTGKQLISMYSPEEPYLVYDQEVWWGDAFDPLEYGREFDFSLPFFEQFRALELLVPKIAIINAKSENCMYTNYSAENRNCYLVVGGLGSEDCYYSYRIFYSKDICDCYDLYECQLCYECLESTKLYDCSYCEQCHNCANTILCKDCNGCKDCFGCVNLKNKQYYIYNRKFSKEDYEKKLSEIKNNFDAVRPDIEQLHAQVPHRFAQQVQCENVSGDPLWQCKDCYNCFTLKKSQDCYHCRIGEGDKDCMDCNFFDNSELQYFNCNNEKNYNVSFSSLIWYSKHVLYSMNCFHSEYLFGCTGMKKNKYCILNKEYSKEEYEELMPKIIKHMQKTGEWGHFFPPEISAFGYNETVAYDFTPLSEEEVRAKGWKWRQLHEASGSYMGPTTDTDDKDICKKILTCKVSSKHYKIIPQELKLYEEMGIPIPTSCPDQRHTDRMLRLNPRHLWSRSCAKCNKEIQTTYAPKRPEAVYCEECYLAEVY